MVIQPWTFTSKFLVSLSRNFLIGIFNSTWVAFISLLAIPFYLKHLGIEAYGLIGFFTSFQVAISVLDLGFTPTINREFSRGLASGNMVEAKKLLHTLGTIYLLMGIAIAIVVFLFSPFLAIHWINAKQVDTDTLSHFIILMGLVIGCRWPIGLYLGALIGLNRIDVSSAVNIFMVTLANVGAILVMGFVSPTIEAFFIWQVLVGAVYLFVIKYITWHIVGRLDNARFNISTLKNVWRFSIGMSGVSFFAVMLMQADKILLSGILSLADYGVYSLAGVVAGGLSLIINPLFNVIYPKMSALVALGDADNLLKLYRNGTRIFSSFLFPVVLIAIFYSKDLLYLWTRNLSLATSASPIVSMLLLGSSLNGVMIFPYALQLSYGSTRIPFVIVISLLFVYVPMIFLLVHFYGVLGGASGWFVLNLIYLFFGTWMTHKTIMKGHGLNWIIFDVGFPLLVSLSIICPISYFLYVDGSYYINLFESFILLLIAVAVNLILLPKYNLQKINIFKVLGH